MEIRLYAPRSPILACVAVLFSIAASAQTVTVSPTSVSFGNQVEGETSAVQKVSLKNGQTSAITISSISTSLSDYTTTSTCPASPSTLAAAATCTISISFKPAAVGARSGTLTVTDTGGSSPQQVTLTGTGIAASLTSIAVTPAAPSVAAGHTEQFTATGTYNNGTKQTLTSSVTWTSSATSVATVSSSGLATSSAQGSATITATSGTIVGSATLTVTAPVLTSIAVTPATASVAAGLGNQFTATGTYSNGTTSNLTSTATWTSSATGIATASTGGLATSVAKGTATITATSGTIKSSATLTVTAAVLTSIAVTPTSPSVAAGLKQQFTATGTYTNKTTANLTSTATWSSSATTIATVSTAGLATSVAQGSTTITATSGSFTGSAILTVTPAVLTSIAVTPAAPSVAAGHTEQFTATGTYSNGTKQNLSSTATWTSSATSVATVSASGLATTLVQGSSTVTATSGTISGAATLTVTAPVLTSIAVTPATASVAAGYTEQFTATGTYSNGTKQNLSGSAAWTSSATSVATVSASGLATTLVQGSSTITATSGTIHGSAALTATAPVLVSIAVTPAAAQLPAGDVLQFTATGTYSNSTTKNLTSTATWTSSATSIAKVSGGGLVTGLAQGSATISATSGSVAGSTALTVTAPVLVSIAVNPGSATIAKGTNQQFTATGTFSDGSTQNVTSSVTWSSSSPVAGVGAGGLASGEGVGTATITAASGTIAGSATLNVGQAVLVSIAVTPANGTFALGTTMPMVATGTYSDGSTLVLTTTATWSTGSSGIATVSAQGTATSAGVGNTTVTAMVGTISGATTVTVNPAVLVSITVTPAIPTIPMGTTQQFTATGSFTDGTTQNLTSTVQWSSDTPAVGVMSTTTPGVVSSEGTGTANITATSGSINGTTQLTVTAAALVSIAVTPADPSIALGTSQQFTATGTFTDGSTQNLTGMVTWSSDTPTTGTISSTVPTQGLATSVATGSANITASSGTISGSTQLAVTAAALVSIAINPATASIPLGTTQQFTATGTYTDGTTQDVTQNGQWTSTQATVATISDTPGTMGLASPLTKGTTTIGISSGGMSATASLVVNPAALVSIAINPPTASIALGTTQQFTATGTYTDQSTQDVTSVVTWNSSTAAAIISNTLGSYGLATSAGQGTTNITATSGTVSASGTLTVNGPNLVSIAITPGNAALPLGESLQFDAVGTYTDGSTQDLTQTAVWASSVPGVVAVNAPGSVSSLLPGSTVVSATSGSVTGSATLIVNSPVPVSLVLTPPLASILTGGKQQFTAVLNYSDGSSVNVTTTVAWNSLNYSIASVSSAGLVAGITSGSTTIQATWGGNAFTANSSITVSAPAPKIWFVSPAGNDANNCLSSATPCFTLAQAESLSAAGDTITLAAGTYRLSPGGSSTAGQIAPKSNQTFIGPPCTPTSAPCQAVISGGVSIGGLALGPDALGNWYVTGQTQQGAVNTSASCDAGWGACIYPEDVFFNGVPLQHVVASSEPALAANQWWFDYTNHIIYFSQNPTGNTVETSVLNTAFAPNGANNVTLENLTVQEFASPVQRGAIDPAFGGNPSTSAGTNWTIENSYITLNHSMGVRGAFGMQVLNNVLTNNGNFGVAGGILTGASINPSRLLVQGNTVTYNNYAHVSPDFGAGGMKFSNTAYPAVRDNTVTNNLGNGIHFDEDSLFPLIDGNTIVDNVDPDAPGAVAGISFEIGFGGATVRNNAVRHNGDTATSGPDPQIVSATSAGMQAYCNVIETGANPREYAFEVAAADRGYNEQEPYLGTYMVSTGNYVHHNTVIWDAGSTAPTGYFQNDATNQPNFFSVNTPPNYNQYHASSTGLSVFIYGNVSGDNKEENFPTYQSLGADVNSTLDTLYTSGFPTVSITSPTDQSSVSNGFAVAASASDPGGINRVEFFVDWNLAGTLTTSPYNFTVGALSGGAHTIAAMAFNNAGIQNCYAITVND
jgi:uncharacterized protein YjdB